MKFREKIRSFIKRHLAQISIAVLVILFAIVYFWNAVFIVVRSGEAGVYYWKFFGGTAVDKVYGEGFHLVYPWDDFFIYNIRIQEQKRDLEVLTKEGMRITLKISIRYQPERELVAVLHHQVGPDYVEKVVTPEVEAVIREVVGRFTADELYTTKHMIPKQIINDSIEQVVRNFVNVQDVIITNIKLPASIQKAIEDKLEQKHLSEAYIYKLERETQEKERKIIEADGIQEYNTKVSQSLTPEILRWQGIKSTEELSKSPNSKVIIIGNGPHGLPVIMNADIAK